MTKYYFFVLVFFVSVTGSAQIKQSSILLGGQLSYYNDKNQIENLNQKSESGTIGVSIGKAFKENSVIGLNFNFSPVKQTNYLNWNDTVDLTYNRFDIGAFFREYKRLAKDFYFFAQLDGAFILANQKDEYSVAPGDVKIKQRGGFVSLTPGISYQVFKKMQLELTIPNVLSMQYLVTKVDSHNLQVKNSRREQISFYSNLNNTTNVSWLGVGFRFLL